MDKRIGHKYLTGGFGGLCFPRDNGALNFMGEQLGVDSCLLQANDDYNRGLARRYVAKLQSHLPKGANVCVLGLAYKPLSHVIEESSGIYLCRALSEAGYRVVGHDPLAAPYAEQTLKMSALVTDSLNTALMDADVVLVTTTDRTYTGLTAEALLRGRPSVTVVDFWRALPQLATDPRISYVPIGRCKDDDDSSTRLQPLWG